MMVARRLTAQQLIHLVVDEESFVCWDEPPADPALGPGYSQLLRDAREKTAVSEAIITGRAEIDGRPVAVVVGEFRFLAGSIGVVAADRIVAAVRRATREGLPVLAAPASGGTRMHEGTIAFTRMIDITAAIVEHKVAGGLYLVYQRHPTTGGAFASWGSLGHITVAEPKSLIGFLGPKVFRALTGSDFPLGVQTGENLYAHGLVDAVLSPHHLRKMIGRVLRITAAGGAADILIHQVGDVASVSRQGRLSAWESVSISRRSDRPGLRTLLRVIAHDVVGLHGATDGTAVRASTVSLARIGNRGAVVVGFDRRTQAGGGVPGPSDLRQVRRGMDLAAGLGLPLITVIDTPGAELSVAAEEGGLAAEIAQCLAQLVALPVPTVSVIMGEGSGGAALALLPSDRSIAAQHSWLSPLLPEGASLIRFGDVSHAERMATEQGIGAERLLAAGVVDEIVEEHPRADLEPTEFCVRLGASIREQLEIAIRLHSARGSTSEIAARRVRSSDHPRNAALPRDDERVVHARA